uniref:Si:ch211-241f5.3 n=1 Tax=Cyprinus carpio TaxID=7962 RepID=A0A8C1YCU0_CYPCA
MRTNCGRGYKNQIRKCVDENECEQEPTICGKNAKCFNTDGSYYCRCHDGFNPTHNFTLAHECKDINECVVGSADCGPNAKCINFDGGYKCTCQTGYISSNGKEIFYSGQGVHCIGKKYFSLDIFWDIYLLATECGSFQLACFCLLSVPKLQTEMNKSLNSYFNHLETWENQTFKINSKVVTATVSNNETTNLKKPVNLTFSHLEKKNEKHICVFWDHKLEGGAWSTEGCTTVSSSAGQTVCSCSHLSSFAVLMALYDIGDVYELRLVTLVGLPLSLVCLLICIVTFYLVRSIQSTRNTIHLHLCISLFIAYFVFLVGITRTENKVGCAVVAGILHYLFLAAFCWMCLEGVQLFRMVVLVFNTTLRPIYMFAAGYGVPAVIVAISATMNASGYGTDNYCWLNIKEGFIWSFYGPVCVIIIVNVFFFLITIWKLAEKFSSLNPDLNSLRKIK